MMRIGRVSIADGVPSDREPIDASIDGTRQGSLVGLPAELARLGSRCPELALLLAVIAPSLTLPRNGRSRWPSGKERVGGMLRPFVDWGKGGESFGFRIGRHAVDHRRGGLHRVERRREPQRGWAG